MALRKRQSLIHTLFEEEARAGGFMRVAGLDEVGRGAPAGPVVAAAVVLDPSAPPPALAKPSRDRLMREYDAVYPHYGFARHVGYGTREHWAALREHGCCPIHRRSFRGVLPEEAAEGRGETHGVGSLDDPARPPRA